MEMTSTAGYAQMSPSTTGAMTGERSSIVKEYEWAVTDLQVVVAELGDRLGPILVPDMSDKQPGGEPMQAVSEARGRLMDLQLTTARIRALISRLEV